MHKVNRRTFIKTSLLTTASVTLFPTLGHAKTRTNARSRVRGANEAIRLAVVGLNGQGEKDMGRLMQVKGVRVVALCDVDHDVLDKNVKKFKDRGEPVESYTDVRKLLENKEVDALCVATPNHWHSLIGIWAVQAGKDVYLEKPVSHNLFEGRQVVRAARKYHRIVQTGSQARSSHAIAEAIAWLRKGHLGKVVRARGFCYKRRASLGKVDGPQPIPPSVDYDLWCGPAPSEPLMRKKLHYDWHWVWPTGNGDLGNQGVHQVDVARWVLGQHEIAPQVFTVGGRLGYEDDGNTPNTLVAFWDYKPAPLIFEVRGLPANGQGDEMNKYRGVSIGNVIECEGGSLIIPAADYSSATALDKDDKEIKSFKDAGNHSENFIDAVRNRKHTDLNADILEGHLSAALVHTANISHRLGKRHSAEEIREAVRVNKDIAEALGRMEEHLTANQVDFRKTPVTLGAVLKIDARREHFTNNRDANKLLTREYRKPFIVPEKV